MPFGVLASNLKNSFWPKSYLVKTVEKKYCCVSTENCLKKYFTTLKGIFETFLMPFSDFKNSYWLTRYRRKTSKKVPYKTGYNYRTNKDIDTKF